MIIYMFIGMDYCTFCWYDVILSITPFKWEIKICFLSH